MACSEGGVTRIFGDDDSNGVGGGAEVSFDEEEGCWAREEFHRFAA